MPRLTLFGVLIAMTGLVFGLGSLAGSQSALLILGIVVLCIGLVIATVGVLRRRSEDERRS